MGVTADKLTEMSSDDRRLIYYRATCGQSALLQRRIDPLRIHAEGRFFSLNSRQSLSASLAIGTGGNGQQAIPFRLPAAQLHAAPAADVFARTKPEAICVVNVQPDEAQLR